jgi:coenzyme F420-0:L-glutamate ligase
MLIMPIKTRTITPRDDYLGVLLEALSHTGYHIEDNDILVVAEKPLATTEGRIVKLSDVKVTAKARKLAQKYDIVPEVAELIVRESDEILGGVPHVLLTIKNNTLMASAGVDKSNVPPGHACLLPADSRASAVRLREEVKKLLGKTIGVMVIDSRTQPLRLGNVGLALGVAGFRPVQDDRGKADLFGNILRIKRRAIADNLASACELIIGEADESVPAALVRDAPVEFVNESFDSSEMWISPRECMYMAIFEQWRREKKRPTT